MLGLFYLFCRMLFDITAFADLQFPISIVFRQENILLGGMNTALLELLIQPDQIQSHVLEILLQNPAVHNQFGKQQFLLER